MDRPPKTGIRLLLSIGRTIQRGITEPIRLAAYRLLRRGQIARYLETTDTPGLILGSGVHRRPGWLASDICPTGGTAIYVDGRRRLPFADGVLAYVFAEHMIEHISYTDGVYLTREIFRVLKPGGVFRVATPDLLAVARLVTNSDDLSVQEFVEVSNRAFGVVGRGQASFSVNRFFFWWGHRFIYDQPTLEEIMRNAGFAQIDRHRPGESPEPRLRNLEIHGDAVGQHMNDYETMVLEARKAGGPTAN